MRGDVEVTVFVAEGDLVDAGYHHREDCRQEVLQQAVQALHEQAHPEQGHQVRRCTREPCRSLYDVAEPTQLRPDLGGLLAAATAARGA